MKPFSELNIPNGSVPGQKIDFVKEVYIPCLSNCYNHKRLTFSFNASVFIDLSKGIEKLIENKGSMKLILGQTISDDEYKSIIEGEQKRKKNFQDLCLKKLELLFANENNIPHFKYKMGLLSNLIGAKKLEIRCAFKERQANNTQPLQHSKVAIFDGLNNEQIVWSSSANLTHTALYESFEDTAIYKSFRVESGYKDHAPGRIEFFDKMWKLKHFGGFTIDSVPSEFYQKWAKKFPQTPFKTSPPRGIRPEIPSKEKEFCIPNHLVYDKGDWKHQGEAVKAWVDNDYHGILAMATGSGKTITAMIAAHKLFIKKKPLLILITVPSDYLVMQWKSEVKKFNIDALAISAIKKGKNEKLNQIKNEVNTIKYGLKKISVLITTNVYLNNESFLRILEKVPNDTNTLIIGDEMHRLAAAGFQKNTPDFFNYRMGLSATPKSKFDSSRDEFLFNYFGEIVYSFDLKDAIGLCLVNYNYYLHEVYLEDHEMEEYDKLCGIISKHSQIKDRDEQSKTNYQIKLNERALIIENAENKLQVFENALLEKKEKDIKHTLVYVTSKNPKQMVDVNNILNKHNIIFHQITKDESDQALRAKIVETFSSGEIHVITAKKILDEGVNIPEIQCAYIIASTSTPREWVQRRGRVLRKLPKESPLKKDKAEIHDFIVLPPKLSYSKNKRKLLKKELERIEEFAKLSLNRSDSEGPISSIARITQTYF